MGLFLRVGCLFLAGLLPGSVLVVASGFRCVGLFSYFAGAMPPVLARAGGVVAVVAAVGWRSARSVALMTDFPLLPVLQAGHCRFLSCRWHSVPSTFESHMRALLRVLFGRPASWQQTEARGGGGGGKKEEEVERARGRWRGGEGGGDEVERKEDHRGAEEKGVRARMRCRRERW